ncbi:unnamed protein product, partial [Toxocara canis]|uniref:COesterase domain-containing protein n=1 Tax=Toxocara canis TaxID=6265 RepID=A0A183UWE7_TOXCA
KDFYVGLPAELSERVATVANSTEYESFKDFLYTFLYKLLNFSRTQNLRRVALGYPKWMDVDDEVAFNSGEVHAVENVAALGVGTARGLASVPAAIMRNSLITTDVWEKLSKPTDVNPVKDIVIDRRALRGHGFFYSPHPTRKNVFFLSISLYFLNIFSLAKVQ